MAPRERVNREKKRKNTLKRHRWRKTKNYLVRDTYPHDGSAWRWDRRTGERSHQIRTKNVRATKAKMPNVSALLDYSINTYNIDTKQ